MRKKTFWSSYPASPPLPAMLTRLLLLVPSLAVVAAADPVTGWLGFPCSHTPVPDSQRRACIVTPDPNGGDDAPTLVQALSDCREQGHVILPGPKYHIDSVMNTTGLRDVKIDIYGVLQVCRYHTRLNS